MILTLLLVGLSVVAVTLFLAPLEALGWWAGWFGEEGAEPQGGVPGRADYREFGGGKTPDRFVIYLDGIAKVGHGNYDDVSGMLDRLSAGLPRSVVLGDILPYSVTNMELTEGRPLSRFWRRMLQFKLEGRRPLLAFSINLRNLLQVLVAADSRYAPIYGRGGAQVMVASLLANGYRPGSGTPIVIVGYSGGVQIGLVTVPFLKRALEAPITMISLAGVMASEPGMSQLEHFHHLVSSTDRIPLYGRLLIPGRWRIARNSHFNRLRRSGKFTSHELVPMRHNGEGSYLDDESFSGDRSLQEITSAKLIERIKAVEVPADAASQAAEAPSQALE
ncbi:MAG TPA: hypothetical protein VFD39_01525 [Trueperaceae bacterium]|nr:hypothetical protein [Trueperaceae bacterium]